MFYLHHTRARLFGLLLSILLVVAMMAGCSRPSAAPTSTPGIPTMAPTTEPVATVVPEVPTAEPAAAEPLPYGEEEVTFQNGDITLAGTLTLPEGDGPFPALILLSGSGQQDRDESLSLAPDYRPFPRSPIS